MYSNCLLVDYFNELSNPTFIPKIVLTVYNYECSNAFVRYMNM